MCHMSNLYQLEDYPERGQPYLFYTHDINNVDDTNLAAAPCDCWQMKFFCWKPGAWHSHASDVRPLSPCSLPAFCSQHNQPNSVGNEYYWTIGTITIMSHHLRHWHVTASFLLLDCTGQPQHFHSSDVRYWLIKDNFQ